MSGFNLSEAVAQSETNEATTPSGSDEAEIPFEENEVIEGYFGFSDTATMVEDISTDIFGNRPSYEVFDINWEDDLGNFEETVEAANDPSEMEKLVLMMVLAKSTFGAKQSELNEGYGMGWDTDESPPKVYNNSEVDHVPYFDVFGDFNAFEMTTLEADEVSQLEDEGLDIDDYGSIEGTVGPMIPVINGERFPVIVEEGEELAEAAALLDSIDFDELTYCPKDGELQGTPTLGPEADNEEVETSSETDNPSDTSMDGDELREVLSGKPTLISEYSVADVKPVLTDITRLRTLRQLLEAEEAQDDRSITDRLEQRIRAEGGDTDDEPETVEEVVTAYGLSDLERQGVEYRVETGKAESYTEAAEQL